jgi:hypothetical protein
MENATRSCSRTTFENTTFGDLCEGIPENVFPINKMHPENNQDLEMYVDPF